MEQGEEKRGGKPPIQSARSGDGPSESEDKKVEGVDISILEELIMRTAEHLRKARELS